MAITLTCLQSRGTIFCSTNLLNKFNKRRFAETGRCFNKLNVILSGPGALLLQERSAIENSVIENSESIPKLSADTSRTIFCAGTESGHTFLAKSKIHRLEYSTRDHYDFAFAWPCSKECSSLFRAKDLLRTDAKTRASWLLVSYGTYSPDRCTARS